MKKRILVISDTHCGALTGLTPPAWQIKTHGKTHTRRNKWAETMVRLITPAQALVRIGTT